MGESWLTDCFCDGGALEGCRVGPELSELSIIMGPSCRSYKTKLWRVRAAWNHFGCYSVESLGGAWNPSNKNLVPFP
jgi:hypothetical protein